MLLVSWRGSTASAARWSERSALPSLRRPSPVLAADPPRRFRLGPTGRWDPSTMAPLPYSYPSTTRMPCEPIGPHPAPGPRAGRAGTDGRARRESPRTGPGEGFRGRRHRSRTRQGRTRSVSRRRAPDIRNASIDCAAGRPKATCLRTRSRAAARGVGRASGATMQTDRPSKPRRHNRRRS